MVVPGGAVGATVLTVRGPVARGEERGGHRVKEERWTRATSTQERVSEVDVAGINDDHYLIIRDIGMVMVVTFKRLIQH